MAVFSEMYQASLLPLPPNKPLPDETGFHDYFSPPPVGQSYDDPNYNNYYYYPPAPQPFPQPPPPPPVLAFPPPPPPPPPEFDLLPFNPPPVARNPRLDAPTSKEMSQPTVNFMVYCTMFFLTAFLLSLTIMIAYAIVVKRSVVPDQWTEEGPLRIVTRPAGDAGHFAGDAVEATTAPSGSQPPTSRQLREGSTGVERTK
ncbi:uncharacterized protein [Dermacentor andersoni]|uniref:uncharacterized protein n=1 Tax=Dermacentor andersoni TaxID=34620 RepID=UPI00241675D9|nr:uncharacterized protein LOC129384252 [Dermacentor andersoni]